MASGLGYFGGNDRTGSSNRGRFDHKYHRNETGRGARVEQAVKVSALFFLGGECV